VNAGFTGKGGENAPVPVIVALGSQTLTHFKCQTSVGATTISNPLPKREKKLEEECKYRQRQPQCSAFGQPAFQYVLFKHSAVHPPISTSSDLSLVRGLPADFRAKVAVERVENTARIVKAFMGNN